jgi:hypothetical protein
MEKQISLFKQMNRIEILYTLIINIFIFLFLFNLYLSFHTVKITIL